MIPSIVSALRSLLTRRARVAVRAFSKIIRISRIAGNRPEWDGPAKVAVPSVNYFMASMPALGDLGVLLRGHARHTDRTG
jgi:hypothetical protein